MKLNMGDSDDVNGGLTHAAGDSISETKLFLDQIQNTIDKEDLDDMPTSLIVTGLDTRIFSEGHLRNEFERIFKSFDECATFLYLKSFRRARVDFKDPASATMARIHCHEMKLGDNMMNCYFAQPITPPNPDSDCCHLKPPKPTKQFLISPPASPPVGWEPVHEGEPIINFELLAAISKLAPGEAHELHPSSESQPGIVVHICEEYEQPTSELFTPQVKIQQTRRPPGRSTSEGSEESDSP
ncbi:Calcipressin-2 [Halotydeus destructor]|nr:Calcipressin-2 [Halotydeus destructor]